MFETAGSIYREVVQGGASVPLHRHHHDDDDDDEARANSSNTVELSWTAEGFCRERFDDDRFPPPSQRLRSAAPPHLQPPPRDACYGRGEPATGPGPSLEELLSITQKLELRQFSTLNPMMGNPVA